MTFVKGLVLIGKNGHGADGAVVSDQGDAAETALTANRIDIQLVHFVQEMVADQDGLPGSNDVFGQKIAGRAGPGRYAHATDDLQLETHFVAPGIERGDIEVFHVEQPAKFLPYLAEQILLVEGGAEGPADFVEDMKLLGTARG